MDIDEQKPWRENGGLSGKVISTANTPFIEQRFSIASSEPSTWSRVFDLCKQQHNRNKICLNVPHWFLDEINAIKIKIDREHA